MIPQWLWTALTLALEVPALVAIVYLLRRPREPRAMLAWILALIFLPGVGLLLFLLFGEPRRRWHRRRRRRTHRRLKTAAFGATIDWRPEDFTYCARDARPELRPLIGLTERLDSYSPTHGNHVTVCHDAERTFQTIQQAVANATDHVHLEYYIFQPDQTGQAVRDLLIAKAREGIPCRLLLDYVGCLRLPRRFVRPMEEAGVHVAFSMPIVPWHGRWRVNYRNHRKIAVIDGQIGFTGSQNIGDEYRGRLAKFGPWRDTHLRIAGPAVQQLQDVFVHDWYYSTQQALTDRRYFPKPTNAGDHVVQLVPSGPDLPAPVMHQLLFAAVSAARSSIRFITPYFVPDTAMILALQSAALRGVRVQLVIPTCSDHRIVLWAGRSFYPELTQAGVEIYEHDETMLHSKVVIVDQTWAMVGSANMDERSFRINFELTAILYCQELAEELHRDFEIQITRSRRIHTSDADKLSAAHSIALGLARLASPLL